MESSLLLDAYFAGLIDGEGYIAVARKDAKNLREKISVKMTCEKTIRSIHGHFQMGAIRYVPNGNPKWQNQWEWYCVSKSAASVIERVRPFLITKADAVDSVLAFRQSKGRAAR